MKITQCCLLLTPSVYYKSPNWRFYHGVVILSFTTNTAIFYKKVIFSTGKEYRRRSTNFLMKESEKTKEHYYLKSQGYTGRQTSVIGIINRSCLQGFNNSIVGILEIYFSREPRMLYQNKWENCSSHHLVIPNTQL